MQRSNRQKPPATAVGHLGKMRQVRSKPPLLLLSILLITVPKTLAFMCRETWTVMWAGWMVFFEKQGASK